MEDFEKRELCRDLMGNTDGMLLKKAEYLPQGAGEENDDYEARVSSAYLFNGFKRAVRTLSGKPFTKPIKRTDTPKEINDVLDNVDLRGNRVEVWARSLFQDLLIDGIAYIFIDFPQVFDQSRPAGTLTRKDLKEKLIRPYWVKISADELIGWRVSFEGGIPSITQIRVRETRMAEVGRYGTTTEEFVRVIEPGRWWLLQQDKKTRAEVVVDFGVYGLPYIPIVPVAVSDAGYMRAEPPMKDLAEINLAHFRSTADQRHILHIVRVPILFGSGIPNDDEELIISPNTAMVTDAANARLGWVEHGGAAIGAGDKDLENLRLQMAEAALELLVPKSGNLSATAVSVNAAESVSDMQAAAISLSSALNHANRITWDWMPAKSGPGPGRIDVHSDFAFSMRDVQEMQIMMQARIARDVARKYFVGALDRRGMFGPDFDIEENDRLLAAERKQDLEDGLIGKPEDPSQTPDPELAKENTVEQSKADA